MNLDLQLDDFVPSDDPCRVIRRIVWDLDTSSIEATYSDIGQRGYPPKLLLSVIFYGYSQGLRSGRKLSQACKTDIRYIFLSQGYRPSKTTINDFRQAHFQSFEDLFKQVVQKCIELGLVDLDQPVFGDGTKIRANANGKRSKTKDKYERWLGHLQDDIKELSSHLEGSQESKDDDSDDDLQRELGRKEYLADKIQDRLERFDDQDDTQKVNLTDPDAHFMTGKKGYKDTNYNPQIVVSSNQVILHNHVCTSSNDRHQLQPCVEGVKRNTGVYPKDSTWDCGYSSFDNEAYLEANKIEAYIPDQEFGKSHRDKPFHKKHFVYHPQKDEYTCPQDKPLVFKRIKKDGSSRFRLYQGTQCQDCPCRIKCTTAKARNLHREVRQPLRDQMYERLKTTKGQQLCAMRKHRVEPVFGHLKHNLGYHQFLLRSLEKVQAEFNIMCIAYNLMKIAKFWSQKALDTPYRLLSSSLRRISRRLNLIVNELLASFYRCFIYMIYFNVIEWGRSRPPSVNNRQWYLLALPSIKLVGGHTTRRQYLQIGVGPRLGGRQAPGLLTLDALLLNVLFKSGSSTFSLCYDLNLSSLSSTSNTFGAFELAIRLPIITRDNCVYCPN